MDEEDDVDKLIQMCCLCCLLFLLFIIALKLEPTNVNIMWDRAAVIYQTEGPKKAMEYYQQALKVILHSSRLELINS